MAIFNAFLGDEDCHHQHQNIINKNVDVYMLFMNYIHVLQKSNKRQNYNQRGDVT